MRAGNTAASVSTPNLRGEGRGWGVAGVRGCSSQGQAQATATRARPSRAHAPVVSGRGVPLPSPARLHVHMHVHTHTHTSTAHLPSTACRFLLVAVGAMLPSQMRGEGSVELPSRSRSSLLPGRGGRELGSFYARFVEQAGAGPKASKQWGSPAEKQHSAACTACLSSVGAPSSSTSPSARR